MQVFTVLKLVFRCINVLVFGGFFLICYWKSTFSVSAKNVNVIAIAKVALKALFIYSLS